MTTAGAGCSCNISTRPLVFLLLPSVFICVHLWQSRCRRHPRGTGERLRRDAGGQGRLTEPVAAHPGPLSPARAARAFATLRLWARLRTGRAFPLRRGLQPQAAVRPADADRPEEPDRARRPEPQVQADHVQGHGREPVKPLLHRHERPNAEDAEVRSLPAVALAKAGGRGGQRQRLRFG